MTPLTIAFVMIAVQFSLIILRAPIALAMGLVGVYAYVSILGWVPLSFYLQTMVVDKFMSYELAVVPLFVLMGQMATKTGISQNIFRAANAWIGHFRGGLAMASVAGCGLFGAICGSSIATASTMTRVALPEMHKRGYSGALSTGSLAAGGTLGILIPPSIILIIFAILTEQNIVKLFLAATVPGLLAIVGFIIAISIYVRFFPDEAPTSDASSLKDRIVSLGGIWHIVALFVIVLGGIYGGFMTPSEAASVGVVLIAGYGVVARRLTVNDIGQCLLETAGTSAMIFVIILGADMFNVALALTRLPDEASSWVAGLDMAPMTILLVVLLVYMVLGCIMDSLSMILLTVPVVFPALMALDFGLLAQQQVLWFGILVLIVVELGLITPPVGIILFVISSMAPDVETRKVFRGVLPFIGSELVRVGVILASPVLTYWLVEMVG
jgi:tripartite ATP-independent transporter DctM subunit